MRPVGTEMNDEDSGFPVKMGRRRAQSVEIKTCFDEKWNYEQRLVVAEGCLTRKRSSFLSLEVNPPRHLLM